MNFEVVLTPTGELRIVIEHFESQTAGDAGYGRWMEKITAAFIASPEGGCFRLAATKPQQPLSASAIFWRDFGRRYLTELCRHPDLNGEMPPVIKPPHETDLEMLALSAPPMQGAEYLSGDYLRNLWVRLDQWVNNEVAASGHSLSEWLKTNAPLWQQVGRVSFHLAENKGEPDLPFAFVATYAPQLTAGGRVQYQPLGNALREYAGEHNKKALVKLLTPLYKAAAASTVIHDLVESGDIYHPLFWSSDEAYKFLKDITLFEDSGILVRIPDWWRKKPRPRVSVTIGEKEASRFGTEALLDFRVDLTIGGESLTPEESITLMKSQAGLVCLRGQWVEVDHEKLSAVLDHWKQVEKEATGGKISFIESMRLLAGAPQDLVNDHLATDETRQWTYINAGSWLSGIIDELRRAREIPFNSQNELKGTLRPYQEEGVNWLYLLSGLGLGACLADDMGLGKTIQVIALLLSIKNDRPSICAGEANKPLPDTKYSAPSLVVLPASLLSNWKAELKHFAPSIKNVYLHPSEISREEFSEIAADPKHCFAEADLVLTTYGMLMRSEWLHYLSWQIVILDEAQAIKNPTSQQTRAVKKLKAQSRIALTGTPLENRIGELWSLFDFLCPGLLGSQKRFKIFVKNLEENESDHYAPLRSLVKPYILRRLKSDKKIIADLPDKTEMKIYCGLSGEQAAFYARTVDEMKAALAETEGIKRRGLVLSYLMRFKQICNHPGQALGTGVYDHRASGKFERLREICEEIASRQEKALIFTQFREITEPVATFLEGVFGKSGLVLHGGTAVKKRRALIDMFEASDGPPFFVLSLKAGGTGLNLTAASHVIHFDRWWNPAVENQATDRAYRIGQKKNVLVHKFICRGTIEEKIDQLIDDKKQLAENILAGGAEIMLTEMDNTELINMVALDLERASI